MPADKSQNRKKKRCQEPFSQTEKQFDRMLTDGLRRCEKTVSADFADKVLSGVQMQTQQKLLAKVVLQERLALAGCIMTSIGAIAVILIFPQVIETLSERIMQLCSNIAQANIDTSGQFEWQPLMIFAIVAAVAACGVFELFFAEN